MNGPCCTGSERGERHSYTCENYVPTAHDIILKWCRSGPRGQGQPVMRNGAGGECIVLDLHGKEPKPGGYKWEFVDRTIARGPTWDAVLEAMRAAKIDI